MAENLRLNDLRARGLSIDQNRLRELFSEALEELARVLYPPDPTTDLPEADVAALRRGGLEPAPASEDLGALAQTAAKYAALIDTSLSANAVAHKLGVDPSRIRQLLAGGKLYGFRVKGEWRIPIFQFEGDRLLPGMDEVAPALRRGLHPIAIYRWFTTPDPDLSPEDLDRDLSPREWLLAGYSPRVVADIAAHLDLL